MRAQYVALPDYQGRQTMIGNLALTIESELFAQQSMRTKWKSTHGGRYQTIQGLAVEDHLRGLIKRQADAASREIPSLGT
jgi:hypothetical protein